MCYSTSTSTVLYCCTAVILIVNENKGTAAAKPPKNIIQLIHKDYRTNSIAKRDCPEPQTSSIGASGIGASPLSGTGIPLA